MSDTIHAFLQRDLFPLLAATLAALVCGLLGNLLVLRRQSLLGDTVSHAVLPGLVAAFLITGSREPTIMLVGATLAGLGAVAMHEVIHRFGRVEASAAMGVSFSIFFALGVVLIERAARGTDLDADCVLHGQLETLVWWDAPRSWSELWSWRTLTNAPPQIGSLAITLSISVVFVAALFKELRVSMFDAGLAQSQGLPTGVLRGASLALVAAAAVASFEAVGSILVIAMLVGPAATARLLTDRMASQVLVSVLLSLAAAVAGYALAASAPAWLVAPSWLRTDSAVNAAGMIAAIVGVQLVLAVLFAPTHGAWSRWRRRRRLNLRVRREDMVSALARSAPIDRFSPAARRDAIRAGLIRAAGGGFELAPTGAQLAERVRRRRENWSAYLVDQAGLRPDHVEETVERLEHVTRPEPPEAISSGDEARVSGPRAPVDPTPPSP